MRLCVVVFLLLACAHIIEAGKPRERPGLRHRSDQSNNSDESDCIGDRLIVHSRNNFNKTLQANEEVEKEVDEEAKDIEAPVRKKMVPSVARRLKSVVSCARGKNSR